MSSALEDRAQIAYMLAEEGVAITMRRTTAGNYNPATGTSAAGAAPQTFTGRGRFGSYRDSLVNGTNIKQGDRRLTFQPDNWSYIPAIDDEVISPIMAAVVAPAQVRELGGTPIVYTLQIRAVTQS